MATNDLLCDGPITKSFLETKLQEFLKTKSTLKSIDGKVISKGLGFSSDVMKVNLTWQPNSDTLPKTVIVKAPKIENFENSMMENFGFNDKEASTNILPMVHAAECRAYTLLSSHNVVPLPKIYGYCLVEANTPAMLIMEDLSDRGAHVNNLADGVTLDQWRNVVEALADLHGWSLATDVPWRKDFPGIEMLMGIMKQLTAAAPITLKMVTEKYPDYFGDIDIDFLTKEIQIEKFEANIVEYRKIMPDVLTHGDTWVNNIFFAQNADGTLSNNVTAIIDWQISLQAAGVFDLCRFALWCVNHEMRRKHGDTIFRHYYDRLKAKAGDNLTTNYEQAKYVYDDWFALNGMFGIFSVMFLLMMAKVDEDPTGKRKIEMLERIRAAYDDGMEFMRQKKTTTVDPF